MKEKKRNVYYVVMVILIPFFSFYGLGFLTYNPIERTREIPQILNLLWYALMIMLFYGITLRMKLALWLTLSISFFISLVNMYLLKFRSSPLVPWDVFSIGTGKEVALSYSYKPESHQILIIILTIIFMILIGFIREKTKKRVFHSLSVIALIGMFFLTKAVQSDTFISKWKLYPFLFTPQVMQERNGVAITLLMNLQYMFVEKPEGYKAENIENSLSRLQEEAEAYNEHKGEVLPDLVVIMNEAFSDLNVLKEGEETRLPGFQSLKEMENTISGFLHVSVLGGNTANTEYEFLTGNSMAFLPEGSIPYQQYVGEDTGSLVHLLKSYGYETTAMHPYYKKGWNRTKVYENFGFDKFVGIDDFQNKEYVRDYISDEACRKEILSYLDQNLEKPKFIFTVTMQNHSPYGSLKNYDNLMEESEKVIGEFMEEIDRRERPTVVVFFGDHQPSDFIGNQINKEASLEERYQVPYIVHANFKADTRKNKDVSANFLGTLMLQQAGLKLDGYSYYLKNLMEKYPIISSKSMESTDGTSVMKERENILEFKEYQGLAYYRLFHEKQVNYEKN